MHSKYHSFSASLRNTLVCGSAMALMAWAPSAMAQDDDMDRVSSARAGQAEIIVTARKRDETAIDVPAAITALGSEALEKYGTRDFWGLQNQVPGLFIQDIPSSSGGAISLRGMSSSPNNPAMDQTIAFNVDGVQVGSGAIVRLGQIDLQQIEVLKGPQALFFGKNSPAGVLSMRTADPGDRLEVKGSIDYEFNAREASAQLAVGGPITDTLGARVVVSGTKQRGWMTNTAQVIPGFTYAPASYHGPKKTEKFVRGTLVFKPTDTLSFRAKYSYADLKGKSDIFDRQQRIFCPYGAPQDPGYGGTIDCKADSITTNGGMDPRLIAMLEPLIPPHLKFHKEGSRTKQHLASLEINYEVAPDINLTSVSGFFRIYDQFAGTAIYQSGGGLTNNNPSTRREVSQEIRLASSRSDWPVNFAVGAYFQDTKITNQNLQAIDPFVFGLAPSPGLACICSVNEFQVDGKAKSVFGQLTVTPIEQIEIAGGVRWSEEKKSLWGALNGVTKTNYAVDHVKFTNTSPEVTIRWRPNREWTVFGAWRNGFKSGGFNTGSGSAAAAITNIDYRPEKVEGYEAGVKYASGPLKVNVTAYTYKYKDLQVTTFDPVTTSQRLVNAASARIKGIEADVNWQTPVDGLELHASLNYNKARFLDFIAGCYAGQLGSQGCVSHTVSGVTFLGQDFRGRQLVLAPDWVGSVGFSYNQPIGNELEFGLASDVMYSANFFGQLEQAPQVHQRKYANVDASIYVGQEDGRWRLSLIGRNLTNVYRARFASQTPLTGNSALNGTETPGGLPDFSGFINRGREIRAQFSFRY